MKNIFVFDLDGTIIIDNKKLDKIFYQKFKDLQNKGHKIVFATSRSLRGIKAVLQPDLWTNPFILCNGAFAFANDKIAISRFLDEKECTELIAYLEQNKIQFYLELGQALYIPNYATHGFFYTLLKEAHGEPLYFELNKIKAKVYKIAIVEPINSTIINNLLSIGNNFQIYQHSDGSVDIVNSTCSKWEILQKLQLKTDKNKIIAFGNDSNDIELIKHADVGVAICPLNEKLKNVATIKIDDCNPASIIKVIDEMETLI